MLSLYLDSKPILEVARQLALAQFTVPWIIKKNTPKTQYRLVRHGLYEARKTSANSECKKRKKSGGCKGQCGCWQRVSLRPDSRRSRSCSDFICICGDCKAFMGGIIKPFMWLFEKKKKVKGTEIGV